MTTEEQITCANNALFVMNFSIQWLTPDGVWHTSKWNSGNYAIGSSKTSPSFFSAAVGMPQNAVSVRPLVNAILGRTQSATTFVTPLANGLAANYTVHGVTLKYSIDLLTVPPISAPIWKNWSRNLLHQPAADGVNYYYAPTNSAELLTALKIISAIPGATLRTSGQRHSQPPLVASDNRQAVPVKTSEYLIDLACYADLGTGYDRLVLGPGTNQVTVNTGVTEDELDAFLTENNLMLQTATAGGFFSIGGMTAVDVHGATIDAPIFAETAQAFTIVKADGSTVTIDKNSAEVDGYSPLQFARVSLGGLGIVTSVTLDVVPRKFATTLVSTRQTYTLPDAASFANQFTSLVKHTRLETFLNPYNNNYLALCYDVDQNPATQTPNQPLPVQTACSLSALNEYGAPDEGIVEGIAEAAAVAAQQSSLLAPLILGTAFSAIESMFDTAASNYSELWLTKAARVIFMSYYLELPGLDVAGLTKAWTGLNAVSTRVNAADSQFFLVGPLEFRFVKGGSSAMSGAYTDKSTDTWFVNLDLIGFVDTTVPASGYQPQLLQFFADVERDWLAMGGLPHNGKMYGFFDPNAPAGSYSAAGPFNPNFLSMLRQKRGARLVAYNNYRKSMDPNRLFYNKYLSDLMEA